MIRLLKHPTPAGTVLPAGMQEMKLQQWTLDSSGAGSWVDVPIEWWEEPTQIGT